MSDISAKERNAIYVTFTQAFRHGNVYRWTDVNINGGKMSDISTTEHNAFMSSLMCCIRGKILTVDPLSEKGA